MSSDLIFPILPRNTKVPVEENGRVKKVAKSSVVDRLNDEEKQQHERVHAVDDKAQRQRHEHEQHKQDASPDTMPNPEPIEDNIDQSESTNKQGRKHIDITI